MATSSRPLSPHLQIYRLPLTAWVSITHRATGVFLTLGTLLLVYWLIAIAAGPEAYETINKHLNEWYGKAALFLWSFAFFFHLCHGTRHLFWDIGRGFDIKTSDSASKLIIIATLLLTLITWGIAFSITGANLK